MNYAKEHVAVRNIALSYTLQTIYKRLSYRIANCGQVLNHLFLEDLVKVDINPDDVTGWETKVTQNGGKQ